MKCPKCKCDLKDSWVVCPECGTKIDKPIVIKEPEPKSVSIEELYAKYGKICRNCKKPSVKVGYNFCPYCGFDFHRPILDENVLVERLKAYRKMQADKQCFSPFCVFTDRTIVQICKILPTTIGQLRNYCQTTNDFYGKKIDKYGNDIIHIIKTLDRNSLNGN